MSVGRISFGARRNDALILSGFYAVTTLLMFVAVFVLPHTGHYGDSFKVAKVRADIQAFMTALAAYKLDTGTYPTTEQGLMALSIRPHNAWTGMALVEKSLDVARWDGPYIKAFVPKDPWGHDYLYKYPGDHGDRPDTVCLGRDGKPGGTGIAADIVSWKK